MPAEDRSPTHSPKPGTPVRGSTTGRPIMALLDLLGRRWALRVLWELHGVEAATFRILQQRCGGLSSSVLADRLAELTEARIVHRGDSGYSLTREGRELVQDVLVIEKWAKRWAKRMDRLERDR